jgi:ABC-type ATPase involved in cell division/GNAT superfamily N-acetyltransferase
MPSTSIVRSSEIVRTPRVLQVEGLYDVPPAETSQVTWNVNIPMDDKPWHVGLIVGPSGAGKSTVARQLFGDSVVQGFEWPKDKSVIDAFPSSMGVKEVVACLTSVGFSSVPSWMRPFHVLSTGEQFRVTVARALAEMKALAVIDEFTSVVDRQVAQIASSAIAKTVRRNNQKLIAVTCHYDVVDWLQPDWIYQPHADEFTWRSLRRRPEIQLEIHPIDRAAWRVFKPHHYMTGAIHVGAVCFGGFINGECVAFTSYIHFPHPKTKNIKMGHRLVVLPDYQGLGIGGRMDDWLGQYLYERGFQYRNVVAHPAMISFYSRSKRWKLTHSGRATKGGKTAYAPLKKHASEVSSQRLTCSFVYVPEKKQ